MDNGHFIGEEGDGKEGDEALDRSVFSVSPSPSFRGDLCSQVLKMEHTSSVRLEDEGEESIHRRLSTSPWSSKIQSISDICSPLFPASWRRPTMPWRYLSASDM